MRRSLLLSLTLTCVSFMPEKGRCLCQRAAEADVPHGANMLVEYSERTLKSIHGKIFFPVDEPVPEAVVEIYDYPDGDDETDSSDLVRSRHRRAACLTDKDGNYCFTGLRSGRYLLRAGTRTAEGLNEVYARVKLDKSWWKFWRFEKGLDLTLTLGT
jgi:hypothetical protein